MSKDNKKKEVTKKGTTNEASVIEENEDNTSSEKTASVKKGSGKKRNQKGRREAVASTALTVLIVIMCIFIVLLASLFIAYQVMAKQGKNSMITNGEQLELPSGFELSEADRDKSPLENFIDYITGKNNKKGDDKSGDNKTKNSDKSSASKNSGDDNSTDLPENSDSLKETSKNIVQRKEEFYNFLVLAKDKGGGNTDTMMVVSFDIKNKSIALLQIPRDTCVVYNDRMRKINSIFSSGYSSIKGSNDEKTENGIAALRSCLVKNFGITIDKYVIIDIEGFREIVDTIGGVDVYVQKDMVYKDKYQNLDINLKKGLNHLDGKKAEQFVRFRKGYINQDLGRIDAQKIFMSAFLQKLFSSINFSTAPELISHFIEYVITDVTLQEATYLGSELLSMGMSNITMHTLQGTAGSNTYVNGVSYFSPYKNANIDLVNQYFNVYNKDLGPDNVSPKTLVSEPGNGKYTGGKTAEEIEKDNPDLKFTY